VLSVVGDIQIFPAVIVVVPDTSALSPAAGIGKSGFLSYVGERAVVIVALKMIRGAFARGKTFQRSAVDEKNIGQTVVVVIENCVCRAGSVNDVLLGVFSTEDIHHCQAGLVCLIDEVGRGQRLNCRCGSLRPCGTPRPEDREDPEQKDDLASES